VRRILVAGLGNVFLGDDGFGCEVARRLAGRAWPAGVRVADFGIRSFDLAFALTDGFDAAVLVDATWRGGAPGTLYLLEPARPSGGPEVALDAHTMDPVKVLRLAESLGSTPPVLRLVGCEPTGFEGMLLSQAVAEAVEPAVRMVAELVDALGAA
jgi:hydrogenase maturation protease